MNTSHVTFDIWGDMVADRVHGMRASAVRDLFSAATRSDIISLSGGMPDASQIPTEYIETAVRGAVEDRSIALQYGATNGRGQLREVLCDLMAGIGVRVKADDLLITSGAQQALDLIAKTFINPGDVIFAEGPTYLGALQAFSAYQPDVHCIPFDNEGLRCDLLEEELRELKRQGKRAKFLYTIPNFQNPGGVTMSPARRRRLIELSDEYGFIILEDDPYGRLRYDGGHVKPLRALSDKVVYLGTVSKVFAPGLRTGWIVAPRPILARINLVKQGADLCGSTFDQVVCEHYFTDTPWELTLQRFVKIYRTRRDAMMAALEEFFPAEASWTHPEGGFFLWVTLPEYVDMASTLSVALDNGVTYTPGDGFFPDGVRGRNCMRLAFCYEDPDNLREAVRRLAGVIEDRLGLYRAFIEAGAIPSSGVAATTDRMNPFRSSI